MILAAGLGTRLGEMTESKPKALIEIYGVPMIERVILHLKSQGIEKFMVNIHHHGEQIIDFLAKHENFGVEITISDERNELLDTGGAILKAADFFNGDEPVLIHNVDVYSEVNIDKLLEYHNFKESFATLCVRKRSSGRALIFDNRNQLIGWVNMDDCIYKWVKRPLNRFQTLAYNGVYLVNPEFVTKIPFTGKFSIIDCWLEMAKTRKIMGYIDDSQAWFDYGTPEKINAAEKYFRKKR